MTAVEVVEVLPTQLFHEKKEGPALADGDTTLVDPGTSPLAFKTSILTVIL